MNTKDSPFIDPPARALKNLSIEQLRSLQSRVRDVLRIKIDKADLEKRLALPHIDMKGHSVALEPGEFGDLIEGFEFSFEYEERNWEVILNIIYAPQGYSIDVLVSSGDYLYEGSNLEKLEPFVIEKINEVLGVYEYHRILKHIDLQPQRA